jgi:hypothetical protein
LRRAPGGARDDREEGEVRGCVGSAHGGCRLSRGRATRPRRARHRRRADDVPRSALDRGSRMISERPLRVASDAARSIQRCVTADAAPRVRADADRSRQRAGSSRHGGMPSSSAPRAGPRATASTRYRSVREASQGAGARRFRGSRSQSPRMTSSVAHRALGMGKRSWMVFRSL